MPHVNLAFSEENNACFIENFQKVREIVEKFISLIEDKKPIHKSDLNHVENLEEETPYEIGETLEHFVAMMNANSVKLDKENVIYYIEMAVSFEGKEYLEELKKDSENDIVFDFQKEYEIDNETMNEIKEVIKNYTQ